MAQPQAYNREVDFTERDGDDTNHAGINAELDAAALSINQIRDNLALIQKDDGSLQNGIVGAEQLAQSAFDAIKTDINEAVQDAQQAAESATLAASTAITARDDAQTAETNAETAAAAALLNANTATTKAAEASASATSAAASALASANSATASQTARLASEAARDAAQSAQTAAAASQTAAATSATSAATSATNAATSASTATTQAGIATTQATNAATSATAAAASFADFNDRYLGAKSTAPTVDNDGNPLQVGTLYYDTTLDQMRVYTPTGWGSASSSVNGTSARFRYIATAGQATFTGIDSNGNTLAYDAGFVDVYLNGQRLDQTDYTASSGTSIVLASAAAVGDELNIVAFGTFVLANLDAGQVAAADGAGGTLWTTVAGFITKLLSSVGSSVIGFIQAGLGAVQRTAQDKMRETVSVRDFGAVGDGVTNDTTAINNAIATGKRVYFPAGTYLANIVITTATFDICGDGMGRTIIKPFSTSLPAVKNMADPGDANFWMRSRISDLSLQGTGNVGNGFSFGDPAAFASGDVRIGRVDFTNVGITGFNKGVFKTCGNIGNNYYNCRVQNNNYNFYAQSDDYASGSAATMHTGFDNWFGGAWGYAGLANIFIKDRKLGKGGWVFTGVDLEGSTGYAVVALADGSFGYVPDLVFDNCWVEANATGGSITIDGLTGSIVGAPRDVYLSGIKNAVAKGMYLGKITLLSGTNFIADKCGTDTLTAGVFDLSTDASSTFVVDGWAYTTGNKKSLTLAPYATTTDNSDAAYTGVHNTLPGGIAAPVKDCTVLMGFSGTAPIVAGGGGYNGSVVADGMTFNTCSEYVVSGSANGIVPSVTATVGKYYAVTFQARLASGSNAYVYVNNMTVGQLIDHSQWRQYSFVKKATNASTGFSANSAGASSTLRIGAMQIVQFDTAQEAYEYLYRGRIATNSDARSAAYPLAAFNDIGGGGASFNSANVAVTLTTSGYTKICEASFRGDLTKIKVDLMVAFNDLYTGGSLDQPSGFTTIAFASTASTPTQVFGNATVTFRWVQQGGTNVWDLQGSVTSGPASLCVLAGLAFIKGK